MSEAFTRVDANPIMRPADVRPTRPDMVIECLLNPGAFRYQGKIGLLLRVAERPIQEEGWVSTPVLDPTSVGGMRVVRIRKDDPELQYTDPRIFSHQGKSYLTTLSHLRLAWSTDGINFVAEDKPTLLGAGSHESFGVEDCRVEWIDGRYYLTYTAVSEFGIGVGMISTIDWQTFDRHGLIMPPHNKDCSLFPKRVGGAHFALHRPSSQGIGGNYIWLSQSPDLLHWGDHRCIALTRPGMWDSERIGAGAAPILTDAGWLAIYHGADKKSRYCLGALLLDAQDPYRVLARSRTPIFEPLAPYEKTGFFGNVVFTNGHIVDGDHVTMYYGASDEVICSATASIQGILETLHL
ncbi:MAG: glycoside hydrolase family 130 protein [Verrucomicrobiota bacterium]|nr:glycoside hydrolase family 130 protein [Verrucomicrobiota bacterium]